MRSGSAKSVLIAGGGAIGLACAVVLAREGHRVVLADPSRRGANASGVAAGMLAPAFESVLDPVSKGLFGLLRAGREAWLDILPSGDFEGLSRAGALWVPCASGISAEEMGEAFHAIEARSQIVTAKAAQALSPGLDPRGAACLFTPEDWHLDVGKVLAWLHHEALALGVQRTGASVTNFALGQALISDGQKIKVDHLILATGLGQDQPKLAPEWAYLSPIKGQILFFEGGGPTQGPAVRSPEGYVVPRSSGAIVGATMEFGLKDLSSDIAIGERLRQAGQCLFPGLASVPAHHRVGVRAETPDGLPLVGVSQSPGVILACGARRNGWLLAALVARTLADQLSGAPQGPWAAQMDPGRFDVTDRTPRALKV
jgi:glycine oxidase